MNKTFCVLEQGKYINEDITKKHKKMFNSKYSDWYRLNWYTNKDPNAFIHYKNITWCEGRNILYEKVPKKYDYYMFIDDDLKFKCENNVALTLHKFLLSYQPLVSTVMSHNWHMNKVESIHKEYKKGAFVYRGQDMELMIFSKDYANIMFPIIYLGGWGCMWYMNYICTNLYPKKQVCTTNIEVSNPRHSTNYKQIEPHHLDQVPLLTLLNSHLYKHDVPIYNYKQKIQRENAEAYKQENPNTTKIKFNIDDLKKVYNIDNKYFKYRKSLAKDIKEINYEQYN